MDGCTVYSRKKVSSANCGVETQELEFSDAFARIMAAIEDEKDCSGHWQDLWVDVKLDFFHKLRKGYEGDTNQAHGE